MDEILAFWNYFNEGRLDEAIGLCSSDFHYVDNQNGGMFDAAGYREQMAQVLEAAPDDPRGSHRGDRVEGGPSRGSRRSRSVRWRGSI